MYSPYLFARSSELLCLRDIASNNINITGLLPILEPVNVNTSDLLRCLARWNSDIILIMNPYQKDFSNHNNVNLLNQILQPVIASSANIIVGILIQPGINFQSLIQYITSHGNNRVALLYDNSTLSDTEINQLASLQMVHFHVLLNNSVRSNQVALLPPNKLIDISDNFRKLARNADYNGPEPFTDKHLSIGQNFIGFGDYTITGKILEMGGGQPSAIAAHLIYKELTTQHIWVKHFVSSNTQRGGADMSTMFLDVSDQITNTTQSNSNQYGVNIGLDHYYDCSTRRHFPGLPKNKQFQMTHHICLMLDVINGRI
ncbi:sce7725 family protein [Proteus cibarius]|uniref:sce7725 family protein n=1 Tax=Proteus terrae TaxID=1574161 RepID=UPI0018C455DE|nr:sce7725 family protein [Proteus terrae]MBG6036857.1 sce7725 family protein [Proteus terrae subsp. cibarius]